MFRSSMLLLILLLPAGCVDHRSPLEPSHPGNAFASVSDGATGGTPHFYFLPPMLPSPAPTGTFDPDLQPVVEVCELVGSTCGPSPEHLIARYTTDSGTGSETIRVSAPDEEYIVNWHTDAFGLSMDTNYRVRVLLAGVELGHADVDVVSGAGGLKKLDTGESIPLVDGRTLPIKFRIERGLVVAISVTPSPAELLVGETLMLSATAFDAHGSVVPDVPMVWTSADPSIATVGADGTASGVAAGVTTIIAAFGASSGLGQVVVIQPCLAPQPTLGFWTFEEGAGTTTEDLTGNGHTGTLQGTPLWTPGVDGGDGALEFDDASDLVNVGPFLTSGAGALTVSAWVNPTAFTNLGDILVGGVSGPRIISATDGGGWSVGHAPGSGRIQVELRGIASFTLATEFPLAQWSHLAVVYTGTSVETYLNGGLVDSRNAPPGVVRQASACTFIGNEPEGCARQTNGNFAWQGKIDDVGVYDRALTGVEVQALFSRCRAQP